MAAKPRIARPSAADLSLNRAREALALALTDPMPKPLVGTAASPGFFNGATVPVRAAADLCKERGWLEPTGDSVGTGKSARSLYRLTEGGAREALARLDGTARASFRSALEQIRQGLQTLRDLEVALAPLQAALEPGLASSPAEAVASTLAGPAPTAHPGVGDTLRTALRKAYEMLCCFREFQNGLVELPRLYYETARAVPGISVDAFRREIESLWDAKAVELHILNEVREAVEPDKGIRRDNKLYYFIYWRAA